MPMSKSRPQCLCESHSRGHDIQGLPLTAGRDWHEHAMTRYPVRKPDGYYRDQRECLFSFVCEGPNRILDAGCGEGRMGAALKAAGKAGEVIGIERCEPIAEIARQHIDQVICADLESLELPFAAEYFDYIIFGDVLEHLVNPWGVVESLARHLRPGGRMIASIPNVRHWRVVFPLVLRGQWRYGPDGVLDDTHLRFFTRKTVVNLFASNALVLNRVLPEFRLMPRSKSNRLNRFTCSLFEDFLAMRYVVDVVKKEPASVAASAVGCQASP